MSSGNPDDSNSPSSSRRILRSHKNNSGSSPSNSNKKTNEEVNNNNNNNNQLPVENEPSPINENSPVQNITSETVSPKRKRKRNLISSEEKKTNSEKKKNIFETPSKRLKKNPEVDEDLSLPTLDTEISQLATQDVSSILEPIYHLRTSLATVLAKLPKAPTVNTVSTNSNNVWGNLISQLPQQSRVPVNATPFTIGKAARCNLKLDVNVAGVICKLHYFNSVVFMESLCTNGIVLVNGKTIKKGALLLIKSGDEIQISTVNKQYSFVFQKVTPTSAVAPREGSLSTNNSFASQNSQASQANLIPSDALKSLRLNMENSFKSPSSPSNISESSMDSIDLPSTQQSSYPVYNTRSRKKQEVTDDSDGIQLPPLRNHPMLPDLTEQIPSVNILPLIPDNSNAELAEQAIQKDAIKQTFIEQCLKHEDIETTFSGFPYFLAEETKELLINSVFIFLKKTNYFKYTKNLPTVSRKILLSGPTGTEVYQENLVKALAKHFKATLLILQPSLNQPEKVSRRENESGWWGQRSDGLSSKKKNSLKEGDRVRYVGSTLSSTGSLRTEFNSLGHKKLDKPQVGALGKVVLTFDDNAKKVGVRFDKAVVGGVDLGGVCEMGHGCFVDTLELKLDNDFSNTHNDSITIETLFQLAQEKAADGEPFILYIKETEKTIMSSFERYSLFKKELSKLTKSNVPFVVVAGSSASMDSKRDKALFPSNLLLSKASHTTLLDFSLFEHISRSDDRNSAKETPKSSKVLAKIFPNKISIVVPTEGEKLTEWKKQIQTDIEEVKSQANIKNIKKILDKNYLVCTDFTTLKPLKKKIFNSANVEKLVGLAVGHHVMSQIDIDQDVEMEDETEVPLEEESTDKDKDMLEKEITEESIPLLTLNPKDIEYGITMLDKIQQEITTKSKSLKEIETENEFEKKLLSEVIPCDELGVYFDDIGALEPVKKSLKELVMLPLQRPELFRKGNLRKPTKGILLFGPPGTGKTMLAKAVATESGANFINVSMSSIGSKWFGEGEKYAKAVFTLASKISPSVIFIDEVDSILGKREKLGEHEAMRKIKNELMSMWDGLRTKSSERIIVMGATNRPFDLDEAVLRRFPRRILVDLPNAENREKIVSVILEQEDLDETVNLKELGAMTEGYSGSDLKNLCIAAAYQPVREILESEEKKNGEGKEGEDKEKKENTEDKQQEEEKGEDKGKAKQPEKQQEKSKIVIEDDDEKESPDIRALSMKDFEKATREISASVSEDAKSINELRKWDSIYGENGERTKTTLSYFM